MDKEESESPLIDAASIMTQEEEEAWLGKYFDTSAGKSMEDHMSSLEKEFEESMQIAAASSLPAAAASHSAQKKQMAKIEEENDNAMHKVYAELHSQADPEIIHKLRMAMEGIPEQTHGLADCKKYFSAKQHYTLQDILVAQYVLNDGLLMRQNHGTEEEYHVDISEPLI